MTGLETMAFMLAVSAAFNLIMGYRLLFRGMDVQVIKAKHITSLKHQTRRTDAAQLRACSMTEERNDYRERWLSLTAHLRALVEISDMADEKDAEVFHVKVTEL